MQRATCVKFLGVARYKCSLKKQFERKTAYRQVKLKKNKKYGSSKGASMCQFELLAKVEYFLTCQKHVNYYTRAFCVFRAARGLNRAIGIMKSKF